MVAPGTIPEQCQDSLLHWLVGKEHMENNFKGCFQLHLPQSTAEVATCSYRSLRMLVVYRIRNQGPAVLDWTYRHGIHQFPPSLVYMVYSPITSPGSLWRGNPDGTDIQASHCQRWKAGIYVSTDLFRSDSTLMLSQGVIAALKDLTVSSFDTHTRIHHPHTKQYRPRHSCRQHFLAHVRLVMDNG
ncbi:hypothetical protein LX36DRAFT_663569 [Colletotrichum falcatum]|nr:hypothetical protein LX36DRAFT_663569 [Colletotrichum falcatum]